MLRIAAAEDLTALTRLRRAATGDSAEDAAGWLQRVAGLENILLLEKPGAPPALMLAAVPVHYAHRKGIWFTGLAADKGVPADKLLPKLLEGALRAFAENGCDFAVMTPDTAADASHLADLGFKNLLPLRVVSKPIRRNLLAQAQFDSLTVRHLMERRLRCQPGCITLPETAMNEMMTQLYRRGLTVVSDRRGYGLYYTKGDTLQFIELQADNDHCADAAAAGCPGKDRRRKRPRAAGRKPDALPGGRAALRVWYDRLFARRIPGDRCVFPHAAVTADKR